MNNMRAIAVLSIALLLGFAAARCPNQCSGHGTCDSSDACTCYDNWMGNDCSLRVCPYDRSWADVPVATNDAHNYAECSDKGICDRQTGECVCFSGYEGRACERMACPNGCSGHGTCETIEDMAVDASRSVGGSALESGETSFMRYGLWDRSKVKMCKCEGGYEGVDCSDRICPRGADPVTCGYTDDVLRVALRGLPKGEYSLVWVDDGGTEWVTRPLRAARYIEDGDTGLTGVLSSGTLQLDGGTTTDANGLIRVGDIITLNGGADLYVTAADPRGTDPMTYVIEAADGSQPVDVGAGATIVAKFGGATTAQVEAALENLPNRVVESVTVSYDDEHDFTDMTSYTANLGAAYLITFTSPSSVRYLPGVDLCGCSSAGCQPIKTGVSVAETDYDVAVKAVSVSDGLTADFPPSPTGDITTVSDWNTDVLGSGDICNTLRHNVPVGYYEIRVSGVNASVQIREGRSGSWGDPVAFYNGTTVDIADGLQLDFTEFGGGDGDTFAVIAPLGVEVGWVNNGRENVECSGRGNCDYATGLCKCFSGYTDEDCSVQTTLV